MSLLKKRANIPESHRDYRIRKADRIAKTQLVPLLCKLSFRCMIFLTLAAASLDAVNYYRYGTALGPLHLLNNLVTTCFLTWSFFAAVLLAASIAQLVRIKYGHVEMVYRKRDVADPALETQAALDNPQRKYYFYVRISAIGIAAFGCLSIAMRIFFHSRVA